MKFNVLIPKSFSGSLSSGIFKPLMVWFNVALLFLLSTCSANLDATPDEVLESLRGTLHYGFAGDLFEYELSTQTINLVAESRGRQGPFYSPEGSFYTTNNWPGNNAGVAVWSTESNTVLIEFDLPRTLIPDDLGVKVAPGGTMFSGILNAGVTSSRDLVVVNDNGQIVYSLDGESIRMRGHAWDNNQNLYFTGEIIQGSQSGVKMMAVVTDFASSSVTLLRIFDAEFIEIPDQMTISPDGQQIAYSYKSNIWIGSVTENATDHRICFSAVQTLAGPVFSPDATHLAMVMQNSAESLRGDIHVASIPTTGSVELTPDGFSLLPGPNSSLNSTWASGGDSSLGWFR